MNSVICVGFFFFFFFFHSFFSCFQEDGLMVMCSVCTFWQHGVCFCIIKEDEAPENHVCDVCAKVVFIILKIICIS